MREDRRTSFPAQPAFLVVALNPRGCEGAPPSREKSRRRSTDRAVSKRQKPILRKYDEPAVGFGACRQEDVRNAEQQRHFAEECAGPVARDSDLLIAVPLGDADFAFEENKKVLRGLPFLDKHLACVQPPFFRMPRCKRSSSSCKVREQRSPRRLGHQRLTSLSFVW